MNQLENILCSIYGKDNILFLSNRKDLCRNQNLSFNLKNGKKLFVKIFSSKKHFERESFLYTLFGKTKIPNTPKLEYVGENFIILERLSPCANPDIYQIIRDIAKLHGNFYQIRAEIDKKIKERVLFKVGKQNIEQILGNISFFSRRVENFLAKNLGNLVPDNQRLIHGDLYFNNILLDNRRNLAYIDWETSKIDWPEKDNVLLILYNQGLYQKIVDFYCEERRKYEKIVKKDIKFSMRYLTILKISEMLYNLNIRFDDYTIKLRETGLAAKFRDSAVSLIKTLI